MKYIRCCKDCKDRYREIDGDKIIDCHSHCSAYLSERKELDDKKVLINKERARENTRHKKSKNKNKVYTSRLGIYEQRSD